MAVKQIVAGSTARDFQARLVTDEATPQAINPDTARLKGRSEQLHGSPIDVALTVGVSPDANLVSLSEFGNLVTQVMLDQRASALYTMWIEYVVNGKTDSTPAFQYEFVKEPQP